MRLTEAQREAVEHRRGRLVVVAGAGSGKTSLLVARYLAHVLEDGLDPATVLTVTFTRKAVAEMRERIVRRLDADGHGELAQSAETGPIETVHGFCERLLRENAFDAEIDPRFLILEGAQTDLLVEDSFRRALEAKAADRPEVEELLTQISGQTSFYGPNWVESTAFRLVRGLVENVRSSGTTPDALLAAHATPEKTLETWSEAIWRSYRQPGSAPSRYPFQTVAALLAKKVDLGFDRRLSEQEDAKAARLTVGLATLVVETWKQLDEALGEARALDFAMLESHVLRVLETQPVVADRVRAQYQALLVDEAQDINPVQHRILSALAIEPTMLVGDAAQCIFGFRGAEPSHFLELDGVERSAPLAVNHRTTQLVLNAVDRVFSRQWGETYVPMTASKEADGTVGVEVWELPERNSRDVARRIHDLVAEGTKPEDIAVLCRSNQAATDYAASLRDLGVPCEVIGGSKKFYIRLEVRDLANALEALVTPHADNALLGVLRSPIVGLSLDSIVLLAKTGRVWERLKEFEPVVPEDVPKLEEFVQWFEPIRKAVRRGPAWEALSAILSESPYLERLAHANMAEQRIANVRKLVRMAASMPSVAPLEFANILRGAQELAADEFEADPEYSDRPVQLMTLHSSKGLEFEVVVLPDVFGRIGRVLYRDEAYYDRAQGSIVFDPFQTERGVRGWAGEMHHRANREEQWRLWYVGMTRAKRLLCLCVSSRAWGKQIGNAIGLPDDLPPGTELVMRPRVNPQS